MIGWFAVFMVAAVASPQVQTPVAVAEAASGPEVQRPSREDATLALVRVVVTEEDVAGAAAVERNRSGIEQLARADRTLASLERRAPGVAAAVMAATVPIILESARTRLPALHQRLARLYGNRLSLDEIMMVTDFLASDPGARYAEALRANQVQAATLASMLRSPSRTPSASALATDREESRAAALNALDGETRPIVGRVRGEAAFAAFERLEREATEIVVDWAGDFLPGERAQINRATSSAIERHLAEKAAGTTK